MCHFRVIERWAAINGSKGDMLMTRDWIDAARFVCLALLLFSVLLPEQTFAADKTLPNTQPLTITQPLDEFMVDGINRFCLRELAASPARREKMWNRNFSSVEAYEKSITPNRERFREYIGAIDNRLTADPPGRFIIETSHPLHTFAMSILGSSEDNSGAMAVNWKVLDGVNGHGLLITPPNASRPVRGRVICLPDADWTPQQFCGISDGVPEQAQLPLRLAEQGFVVLVPFLVNRSTEYSGSPHVAFTNQSHREFIYRQAFEMGRHVIGYEVQKVLSAVDVWTSTPLVDEPAAEENTQLPIAVAGVGEGALLALYAAALDPRIKTAMVSGYFGQREGVWEEPIYRNVWGLLTEFGDAELAGMIAPRSLIIEACRVPEVAGPEAPQPGRRGGAAPGKIQIRTLGQVRSEFDRALRVFEKLNVAENLTLVSSGEGDQPAGTREAIAKFCSSLDVEADFSRSPIRLKAAAPKAPENLVLPLDPEFTLKSQLDEMQRHVQDLMRLSPKVRDKAWAKGDRSSVEKWEETSGSLRDWVYDEMIGRLPEPTMPMNPKSRLVLDEPEFLGYEITLDCYRDVVAGGILLLPKDLKPGEKRPVVVCQHGLEGTPMDTITEDQTQRAWRAYKGFSAALCKRGFIVYAPQNPYRGRDRFRTIQRKSNPLKRSLFSYIIPQHQRTLDWLATLPNVDSKRIGFYGLSYGGKTAVRVPPMLTQDDGKVGYCLSICSADFNEWVKKNVSNEDRYSYLFTGEYEIFEWNMGHVANYAELSSLMAPRPFMVERGHDDGVAPDEWVAWEYAKVRRHYDKLGIGDRTEIEFFNGPHTINGQGTYRFLHRHLNWPEPSAN